MGINFSACLNYTRLANLAMLINPHYTKAPIINIPWESSYLHHPTPVGAKPN